MQLQVGSELESDAKSNLSGQAELERRKSLTRVCGLG
jgi:hypothetical protein